MSLRHYRLFTNRIVVIILNETPDFPAFFLFFDWLMNINNKKKRNMVNRGLTSLGDTGVNLTNGPLGHDQKESPMRNLLKCSSIVGIVCLGVTSIAHSADLDKIISPLNAPTIKPVEVGNGWYLRGDIGYTAKQTYDPPNFSTFSVANGYRAGTVTSRSFKDDFSLGGGIGYQFTDMFRGDVTLDLIKGDFALGGTGLDTCAAASPVGTTCNISTGGRYDNYMAMVNGYMDLGTISGFTPYIGAGAGYTKVSYRDVSSTGACVDGGGVCGTTADVTASHSGHSEWRKTWALMAGMSYDLNNQVKVDLGYKYSNIEAGTMYGYNSDAAALGASGAQANDGGFERHEVRLGVRLSAW